MKYLLIILFLIALCVPLQTEAYTTTLLWDPPSNYPDGLPAGGGYKIYYGNASRGSAYDPAQNLDHYNRPPIDVGNVVTYSWALYCGTYWFSATAYLNGMESWFSNEVSKTVYIESPTMVTVEY